MIKVFPLGIKNQVQEITVRKPEKLTAAVYDKLDEYKDRPKVTQLVNQQTLDAMCDDPICIIGFLPAAGTNKEIESMIDVLYDLHLRPRTKEINFL